MTQRRPHAVDDRKAAAKALGGKWTQYEETFPALAASRISEVSLECIHSRVPLELLALLKGKDVQIGVIDVASDTVESPEEVAGAIEKALKHVASERIVRIERRLLECECSHQPHPSKNRHSSSVTNKLLQRRAPLLEQEGSPAY